MGSWLAPVEMPVQTYMWNKRAVAEDAPEAAPGGVAVAVPDAPPVPPMPVAAATWSAPAAPVPVAPATGDEPRFAGLAVACVLALVMPLGIAFAVEAMRWRHPAGTNTTLLGVVAVTVLVGSCLIGILSSELGHRRSIGRGLAAAALSGVTAVLLAVVIDSHPAKFGFDVGPSLLVAALGPVLAFLIAATLGDAR
jgi:hypothetical protein